MSKYPQARKIRARKIGVLLIDARLAARRTPEECALAMGVSPQQYRQYEQGLLSPSLPEIEILAYFLNIPLEHFWSSQARSQPNGEQGASNIERMIPLRQRMVSTLLRQQRISAGKSLEELSEASGIPVQALQGYETNQKAIPLPELETLAGLMNVPLAAFYDQRGPVGQWRTEQDRGQKFNALPTELQDFVAKPVNKPYIELAMRLSELSVERLRAIAEGLLEITY